MGQAVGGGKEMNRFTALLLAAACLFARGALAAELTTPIAHVRAAWATPENDLGETDPSLRLTNLTLVLNRPPERQAAFETLLRDQQNPGSPNFHRWMSPAQIGEQFGARGEDIAAVTSWLQSQGLHVDSVASSRVRIEFSGTAGNVGVAFGAPLHTYVVDGEQMLSPAENPRVPASVAALLRSVQGLQSVRERPHHHLSTSEPISSRIGALPKGTFCAGSSCSHYIAPGDFASIYDLNPVYQQGINGSGQTIAIIGRARVWLPDIENFQKYTGLPTKDPVVIVPPNGIDPGASASTNDGSKHSDQFEATIDVTRAASVAPGATIDLVISANPPSGSGIGIASQYVVDSNLARVMSISFGNCEQSAGQAGVSFWDSVFSQAAAQGISVFVSSGDSGAAGCDKAFTAPPISQAASPNYICASSYATCVGGTQFADSANSAAYWNSSNSATRASAYGYIPEGAWNEPLDSASNVQVAASGGGVSGYIATPYWQAGPGVPGRQGRYTPDVSFSASGHDSYLICFAASGACVQNSSGGFSWTSANGTSAAAPSMAGIAALLNQKMGSPQRNLNPQLYALAAAAGNGAFHDITTATLGCDQSIPSMCNNSTPGPTGLAGGLTGYPVGPGYDLVTGLGSIDVANLLTNWSATALPGQLQLPAALTFPNQTIGTQSAPQTVAVTNVGGAPVTISNVTGTDLTDFPGETTCFTTLQPGQQCTVTLSFAPAAAGAYTDVVTFTSNGVGSPQSFTVSGTGVAGNAPGPLSGLWYNANESGWGIGFTQRRNIIFAAWFTYDSSGNPKWYVASNCTLPSGNNAASGTCSGSLYEVSGPTFFGTPFNPALVHVAAVGSLTVDFQNANAATMSYTVNGQSRTVAIVRQILQTGSTPPPVNYTDLWWNPNESGWGLVVSHQYGVMFLAWFVYDDNGKPVWYVVPDCVVTGSNCTGTVYGTTGPPLGPSFDPTLVHVTAGGTVTLNFSDANNGILTLTVNGVSGSKSITRELF
jgi:hypothetical protein